MNYTWIDKIGMILCAFIVRTLLVWINEYDAGIQKGDEALIVRYQGQKRKGGSYADDVGAS